MKIIDVRDGFIKFEADKSIYLSSFIQVDGTSKSYIAQVNQLKVFGEIVIASAKILFITDGNELKNYDKTEPPKDAEIKSFTLDILNNSINAKKPVIIGKTLDNSGCIKIDADAFNKKMLISVDDKNINNILIRNFLKQFENLGVNTVVLDTLGIAGTQKYKAGIDFKLPLNTSSLAFMYESCLNDATADSKSTIMEIFRELSEYSKTVPFVPFATLKTIVDDMVDKQHVFKLLVLKNKLAKFEKMGYFASSQVEVDNLSKILSQKCAIIDLSGMDTLFQNRYLEFIYEKLAEYKNIQVFLETSNTVSKKNLKHVISDSSLPTTLITHSKFQYLNDIKNMFDNFIIEPTFANNTVFQVYSTFLGSMKKNTYLIAGEAINYIPIVSEAQVIDEVAEYTPNQENESAQNADSAGEKLTDKEPEATEEATSSDVASDEDIINISIDEESEEDNISKDEIIASIDEKSDNAIESIKESLETPDEIDLFENNDEEPSEDTAQEDIEENIEQIEEQPAEEEIVQEEQTFEEEPAEDIITELESDEELINEDDLGSDLSEINEESVNIADIPNEEMAIEDTDDNQDMPTEELSEEMLEDSPETETSEELSEQLEPDVEELVDASDATFEEEQVETSIELDNDVEMLLDEQEQMEEVEEYPQNTTLDVDFSEPKIMPLTGEALNHDFDEIVELDPSESVEDDIVVDMSDDEQINIDTDREQEILEEVDKVYTTMKEEDNNLEEISDSDLDLIDELNNDGEELEEYHGELEEVSDSGNGILEEVHQEPAQKSNDADEILEHKESSTPIVPLYDADIPQEDMVMSDPIQQGDAVIHAKYGNGVVEKMIKYGTKTLYAINFENIGRRLLDPTLTEIKRV